MAKDAGGGIDEPVFGEEALQTGLPNLTRGPSDENLHMRCENYSSPIPTGRTKREKE